MMMTLWRGTIRHLSCVLSERTSFSIEVATRRCIEKNAVKLIHDLYPPVWWDENLLTEVQEIGQLKAAEGMEVPQEELDY